MKNSVFPITGILISAIPMTTCGSSDKIWPSDRIGPMWVNRYGHTVDLPAFNVADFDAEQEGKTIQFRLWRIRLREIPEGLHTLHYVMHVHGEVDGDPASQPAGTYELVVNFTFEAKQ